MWTNASELLKTPQRCSFHPKAQTGPLSHTAEEHLPLPCQSQPGDCFSPGEQLPAGYHPTKLPYSSRHFLHLQCFKQRGWAHHLVVLMLMTQLCTTQYLATILMATDKKNVFFFFTYMYFFIQRTL